VAAYIETFQRRHPWSRSTNRGPRG